MKEWIIPCPQCGKKYKAHEIRRLDGKSWCHVCEAIIELGAQTTQPKPKELVQEIVLGHVPEPRHCAKGDYYRPEPTWTEERQDIYTDENKKRAHAISGTCPFYNRHKSLLFCPRCGGGFCFDCAYEDESGEYICEECGGREGGKHGPRTLHHEISGQ